MMNQKKFYVLSILLIIAAFLTNVSAQTASRHHASKPPTKVKTNPPKPPTYVTCGFCGGSGRKSRYNARTKQYDRIMCTACSGSGRRRR
jgi:DnaJ-class molecular chaperone